MKRLSNDEMARRVARDIPDGAYINLGIGLPNLVGNHVPEGREIMYHSENGLIGAGPAPAEDAIDPELINASKQYVTTVPGAAFFDHPDSFAMMRGGHLDIAVLGAYQVSATGDLANWATLDESFPPAVGGAMDLAVGVPTVFVLMRHIDRDGAPKILRECTYPLTGAGIVNRIYTDLAVLEVTSKGLMLVELAEGNSLEEVQAVTGATIVV